MDTGSVLGALVTLVRIAAFALLCWGGWLCFTYNLESTGKPAHWLDLERAGSFVLFALLWATFEGLAR